MQRKAEAPARFLEAPHKPAPHARRRPALPALPLRGRPAPPPSTHHRPESAGRPEQLELRAASAALPSRPPEARGEGAGRRGQHGAGVAGARGGSAADMPLAKDLVHPSLEDEKRKHKKKRLVQSPNSYFMDVKCPGCYKITTVFSHAQTVVLCVGCSTVLCQPTGGKARLTEGCSFRRKQH
ncbi:40S ribosomal protein S27-like [Gymnogyps californianus]|uniref:40S ribosomal protein S27-like n=1 Tax=Gymnogyps californianus TaxID=33616 RepID=UPI0021CAE1CD|nr:40S ribosomal protein S27-like [Gymnogyps californianus]